MLSTPYQGTRESAEIPFPMFQSSVCIIQYNVTSRWHTYISILWFILGGLMCILAIVQPLRQSLQMCRAIRQWYLNRYTTLLARVCFMLSCMLHHIVAPCSLLKRDRQYRNWELTVFASRKRDPEPVQSPDAPTGKPSGGNSGFSRSRSIAWDGSLIYNERVTHRISEAVGFRESTMDSGLSRPDGKDVGVSTHAASTVLFTEICRPKGIECDDGRECRTEAVVKGSEEIQNGGGWNSFHREVEIHARPAPAAP